MRSLLTQNSYGNPMPTASAGWSMDRPVESPECVGPVEDRHGHRIARHRVTAGACRGITGTGCAPQSALHRSAWCGGGVLGALPALFAGLGWSGPIAFASLFANLPIDSKTTSTSFSRCGLRGRPCDGRAADDAGPILSVRGAVRPGHDEFGHGGHCSGSMCRFPGRCWPACSLTHYRRPCDQSRS